MADTTKLAKHVPTPGGPGSLPVPSRQARPTGLYLLELRTRLANAHCVLPKKDLPSPFRRMLEKARAGTR